MGQSPLLLIENLLISMTKLQTIIIVLIVGLILLMSRIMKEAGHMDRLVKSFTRLSKDGRTVASVMSALIGLLPMPGGALFSAPMVETSLSKHAVTCEQKTVLNYWFRHIWEYWWPLYPGVVLAVALLEVDIWLYMTIMSSMTLVSALTGVIFILRPIEKIKGQEKTSLSWSAIKEFLWEIMPILIVVFVIMALAGLTGILGRLGFPVKIPGALSMLPGLIISMIWVCAANHISFRQFRSAFMDRNILPMLVLILAIMVFKGIMTESGAVVQIRNELMAYRIPVILIIIIMPFLSGFISGVSIGFVGTSFPLIIPMFQTNHVFEYMSFVVLAYSFGFMGMMLSPVHLCLLVTKDYFKARLLKSYRQIILPVVCTMLTAIVLFFALRAI